MSSSWSLVFCTSETSLSYFLFFFFFFSSRRRHTRSLCDWSSDVCSSDLLRIVAKQLLGAAGKPFGHHGDACRRCRQHRYRDNATPDAVARQETFLRGRLDRKSVV